MTNMLQKVASLAPEEQESILNLTKSLSKTICDLSNNMDIIEGIEELVGDRKLDEDSLNKFNAFASTMKETENSLNALENIDLSGLDKSKIDDVKKLGCIMNKSDKICQSS